MLRGAAELVNEDGRTIARRRRARLRARPERRLRLRTSSTPRRGMRSIAGRRRAAIRGSACLREYLPENVQAYAATFDQYGSWQNEPTYGYVWYPRVARRLAPVLLRPLDDASAVGLDVDWIGSVGVADAPLRAMGLLGRRVVLDPRPHVGPGVGVVGVRARLRELVPARLEQPRGVRVQCQVRTAAIATTLGTRGPSCRIAGSAAAT